MRSSVHNYSVKKLLKQTAKKIITSTTILSVGLFSLTSIAQSEHQRYIVKFKPGKSQQVHQFIASNGGELKLSLEKHDAVAALLPPNALKGLSKNPNVEYIEIDPVKEFFLQETPSSIPQLQADLLSDELMGSQKICVIDSGLDATHEDIAANKLTGDGNWAPDTHGHGTYMVSAIASINNDVGVVGVAPNGHVNIHMQSIYDLWRRHASDFVDALDKCQLAGSNIVTISAGSAAVTKTEEKAFQQAYDNGLLIFAAVGNNGDTTVNYPSGYSSVIGVGAVDQYNNHAFFSVQNDFVELMAPGWYTKGAWTRDSGKDVMLSDLIFNGNELEVTSILNSVEGDISAPLVDCGDGLSVCSAAQNSICLISATNSKNVTTEVQNCQAGGGLGAVVHGDQFIIAYNEGLVDKGKVSIPAVGLRDNDATTLRNNLGATVQLKNWFSQYKEAYGTSMSTPYAAAVAGLVWSYHPECSNQQIRDALTTTAIDLGDAGRDNYFGFGLVQALDAKNYLDANGCGSTEPPAGITLDVSKSKVKGKTYADLSWTGVSSTDVDIYRDGSLVVTTTNSGSYSEQLPSGTYSYQVCEVASSTCSGEISISL